jgi:hypothetical protein
MIRAIFAGGGIALIGVFAGALYFVSAGGPNASGQMTSHQALTTGILALFGGIGAVFFSRRLAAASSWIITIVGWILGSHLFPPILVGVAVMIVASSR